jgi:hypothetical protein
MTEQDLAGSTMNYDDAENVSAENVTLAQWARAQALQALMSRDAQMNLRAIADQVNILAELIVSGSLPTPAPGTFY